MSVNMNLDKIKTRCGCFFCLILFSVITWGCYEASVPAVTELIQSRSIVCFLWGSFFLLFVFPVCCCFVFVIAYVTFTKNMQPPRFFAKGITVGFHVMGAGFIIGNILSLIAIFYPLGTNYVLCERPGPFSGTYYTRTEEICTQVKYLLKTRARDIEKLNDKLDGVSSQ
ncbi:DUF1240 domain-containing protein [Enterobacter cloacae]|uniref:hypothetical protein n=1 Tax=Enterobacter sp. GD03975 TaxID=2975412 RepID=UPI0007C77343|nr:hypothetical protein [Enterobacter sp. GD03975]MDH1127098.1 DUF1240 domain-containing protein [Enterobacter sp. GD03975]OAE47438.1 DUF1240 domain-containing protein [Enterobacter cloacae]OAE72094.1 DUF1240 domain-containing protein [Enterobacter cloacae]OAZ46339.1 DUF1240 domain-containing protein [Enterobacter cloacae]